MGNLASKIKEDETRVDICKKCCSGSDTCNSLGDVNCAIFEEFLNTSLSCGDEEKQEHHKPKHYQNGTFETIDEMVIVFGVEAVIQFCRMNAWKYRARAAYKGQSESDMKKADEYLKIASVLIDRRQKFSPSGTLETKDFYYLVGDREDGIN